MSGLRPCPVYSESGLKRIYCINYFKFNCLIIRNLYTNNVSMFEVVKVEFLCNTPQSICTVGLIKVYFRPITSGPMMGKCPPGQVKDPNYNPHNQKGEVRRRRGRMRSVTVMGPCCKCLPQGVLFDYTLFL